MVHSMNHIISVGVLYMSTKYIIHIAIKSVKIQKINEYIKNKNAK